MHAVIHRSMIALLGLALMLVSAAPRCGAAPPDEGRRPVRRAVQRPSGYLKNNAQIKALFAPAMAQAAAATVRVLCEDRPAALGTIVSPDGLIVTKSSLVADKPECKLADGRKLAAEVVGRDETTDLAVLRVDAKGLTAAAWAGDAPSPGSIVAAAGPGEGPLLWGVISDVVQPIPGPIRADSRHGWLGISVGPSGELAEVQGVSPGSAAEKCGLRAGDQIQRVNDRDIRSSDQLIALLRTMPPKQKVVLAVIRKEKQLQLEAVLDHAPGKLPHDNWGGGPFSDRRWGFAAVIPHDLAIAPADCGGPLVDIEGRCVGVNIARALRVTSYALPAAVVRQTVEKFRTQAKAP